MASEIYPGLGVITGLLAVFGWALVFLRELQARRRGVEHRSITGLVMAGGAFIAALGTVASALGAARIAGLDLHVSTEVLSLVASMGRGALAATALVLLTNYHPPKR